MQTFTICMQCQAETGAPNFSSLSLADIPESGVIESICNRGHRTATIIQQTKFEILTEMGIKGIVTGSYRDAVSSFATSLERLYEYFIEAACRKHGILPEEIAATWKPLANLSERQLGAFLIVFLIDTHQTAKLLPKKQVELRNAIIHKGKFATREEALQFGQAVFNCAHPVLTVLRSEAYAKTVRTLTSERIHDRSKQPGSAGLRTSTLSISTPLSMTVTDQSTDIEALVATYAKRPDLRKAVEEAHNLEEGQH